MRPHIAVISQQYGTLGGGEIFAREVTERIARSGAFEMHVFSRKWESDCREVTFHRVPMWGVPRQLIPTAFAWMASRMARRMGFDLVHAQSRVADADVFSVHWCPHAFWTRDILTRKPRWSDRLRMRLDDGMLHGGTNRVYYYPAPQRMLIGTDRVDGRAGWDEWVVKDSAIKCLLKEESIEQAASIKVIRDELFQRFQLHTSERDAAQPERIRRTALLSNRYGWWR